MRWAGSCWTGAASWVHRLRRCIELPPATAAFVPRRKLGA
jgi:hypothetical protein